MTSFEDLDDDVLYLILDYLYLERSTVLRTLQGSSRRLRNFADAVLHRTLSLIDDEAHEQITYRLVERLKDHSDKLCYFVRNLCVVGFRGDAESYCLNSALIAECLNHIRQLDTFMWNCNQPISQQIRNILQQRFPNAQVCANITLVNSLPLEIPQLHRLDVCVPCVDLLGENSISLFSSLKQALLRLSSLRHLSIDTYTDTSLDRLQGIEPHRLQIPLESGDQLPSLATLEFRSTSYDFDVDHCRQLLASVDCSTLQKLTIGSPNPTSFFEIFNGRLPSLADLDISFDSIHLDDPRQLHLQVSSNFLAGLESLKKLAFRVHLLDVRSDFAQTLQDILGSRLKHLKLLPRLTDDSGRNTGPQLMGNIRKFLWKFTGLECLDVEYPDMRSYYFCQHCFRFGSLDRPVRRFTFIPPGPSLRYVNLSIRARYTEQPLIASVTEQAHCAIRHQWSKFANQSDSQLEALSIRFWRWETGRKARLQEVVYDAVRLRGQLIIRVRDKPRLPVAVYSEVREDLECGNVLVKFGDVTE